MTLIALTKLFKEQDPASQGDPNENDIKNEKVMTFNPIDFELDYPDQVVE